MSTEVGERETKIHPIFPPLLGCVVVFRVNRDGGKGHNTPYLPWGARIVMGDD